jgi:hypothetical protein
MKLYHHIRLAISKKSIAGLVPFRIDTPLAASKSAGPEDGMNIGGTTELHRRSAISVHEKEPVYQMTNVTERIEC